MTHAGVAELGAIGFAWIWTLFGALVGVATGVQVFVARHDGAGERVNMGAIDEAVAEFNEMAPPRMMSIPPVALASGAS